MRSLCAFVPLLWCTHFVEIRSFEFQIATTKVEHLGSVTLPCKFYYNIVPGNAVNIKWSFEHNPHKDDGHDIYKRTDGVVEVADGYATRVSVNAKDITVADLELRNLTKADGGYYKCKVYDALRYWVDIYRLEIVDAYTEDPNVGLIYVEGHKRFRCTWRGFMKHPKLWWYDSEGKLIRPAKTNLDIYVEHNRTAVSSVLNLNIQVNRHYFCRVSEGDTVKTARVVLSDGSVVRIHNVTFEKPAR
ncbi:ORF99 [Ranid herpesvirus 2]|uniref:ORF99 n=1 Tax=Ranid herpesvirus 2 TaxID=389214 RepID=Q14W07_9VIRU|nr:ORF99 [Ranid herpesvirus 2]ABG25665.1 ORF99 [Ranid herpesvirus 2]